MIFCSQGRCEFMGTGMDLSADLSIIIEHYFSVFEEEYDEKTTKALFESVLKTAMDLKKTKEERNGKTDA